MKLLAQLALLWIRPAAAFLPRTYARSSLLRMSAGTMAGAPAEKHTVLVVGCGGKLGSLIFGWLQEASNNGPRTGMKHPRGLTGHPKSACSTRCSAGRSCSARRASSTCTRRPRGRTSTSSPCACSRATTASPGSAMATERWQIRTPSRTCASKVRHRRRPPERRGACELRERADRCAHADGAAAGGATPCVGGALGGGAQRTRARAPRARRRGRPGRSSARACPSPRRARAPQPALKDAPVVLPQGRRGRRLR